MLLGQEFLRLVDSENRVQWESFTITRSYCGWHCRHAALMSSFKSSPRSSIA